MAAYNSTQTSELEKKYFNIKCPSMSLCPEGMNCTKDPITCNRAREMSALNIPDLNKNKGLETSLEDYFSSENNYDDSKTNYLETANQPQYQTSPLVKGLGNYTSLSTTKSKYDTSATYETANQPQYQTSPLVKGLGNYTSLSTTKSKYDASAAYETAA